MEYRPYQDRAKQAMLKAIGAGATAPCLVAPTGSGKTFMGVETIIELAQGAPIIWLVHRDELIEQTVASLRRAGVARVSVLRAHDPRRDDGAQITVASIQTLIARPELRPWAPYVVWDECHHSKGVEWESLSRDYEGSIILGLTATPERADGKPLGDIFDVLIEAASYTELIDAGHLVPCEVVAPQRSLHDGALAMSVMQAVEIYAKNQCGIVFCQSIDIARDIAGSLPLAACVDGGTHPAMRRSFVEAYRLGLLDWLTNFQVLTEGFDAPRARVCVLARACGHISAYLQIVGRVLRPYPGKDSALLIDLTGENVKRYGVPGTDMDYSLEGAGIRPLGGGKKKKRNAWVCPSCFVALSALPPSRVCPKCNVPVPRRMVEEYEQDEMERRVAWQCPSCGRDHYTMPARCLTCGNLSPRGTSAARESTTSKREWYLRLLTRAIENKWRIGWAAYQFKNKHGQWPPWAWKAEYFAEKGIMENRDGTTSSN